MVRNEREEILRVLFLKETEIGYFLICRKSGFGQHKLSRIKTLVFSCVDCFVTTSIAQNEQCKMVRNEKEEILRVMFLKEVEIGYFLICRKSGFGQHKLTRIKTLVLFVC